MDLVPESRFPSRRIFTLVGTNRNDYEAAAGLSRAFVGHGSDGLVKIDNATLYGLKDDGSLSTPTAKAFVYRSHSGPFGIVNSEEAFQNLARFLFGDVRVDLWLEIDEIRLPRRCRGSRCRARHQCALPNRDAGLAARQALVPDAPCGRGGLGGLSLARRLGQNPREAGRIYLSSVFLANRARSAPSAARWPTA